MHDWMGPAAVGTGLKGVGASASQAYSPDTAEEQLRQQQAYFQNKSAADQTAPDTLSTVLLRINAIADENRREARALLSALQGSNGKEEVGSIPGQGLISFLQGVEEMLVETKRLQREIAQIIN